MATADDLLSVARSYLGEGPDRFTGWYPAPSSTPWCCIFVSFCASQVGIPTHYAWVSGLFDQMRAEGRTLAPRDAQPGDYVAFDYDGGGPRAYDHIAIVESVDERGIVAVNGNWQNRVQRVLHRWDRPGFPGGIAEIARPPLSIPDPSPEEDNVKPYILWQNGTAWHCFGNTRVGLTDLDQYHALRFIGVEDLGEIPHLLASLAIIPRNGGTFTPGK